jgi:hypothetical protein
VIADAARTMPHALRSPELPDEITAELTLLVGFDQDLAAEATRTSNRKRGLVNGKRAVRVSGYLRSLCTDS